MSNRRMGMLPLGPSWSDSDFPALCRAVGRLELFITRKFPGHNLQVITCTWPAYYEMMVVYDMEDPEQTEMVHWLEDNLPWDCNVFAQEGCAG
jgi:hypothetical protein